MTKEEQEFLEKNFPAGSFTQLTILVRNEHLEALLNLLKGANLTLAAVPSARAALEYETMDPGKKVPQ